jgi:hypothetical protein
MYSRKLNSENIAREELIARRKEREDAREAKEKEDREEKRKEREREDRRDQMAQIFQMKMIQTLSGTQAEVPINPTPQIPEAAGAVQERLELNLKWREDSDSETYPVKVFVESYEQFISALREFCVVEPSKPVKVILFHLNRILDLFLLENGKTYTVELKNKDDFVRIYLD